MAVFMTEYPEETMTIEHEESLTSKVRAAAPELWARFVQVCNRQRAAQGEHAQAEFKRVTLTSMGGRTTEVTKVGSYTI